MSSSFFQIGRAYRGKVDYVHGIIGFVGALAVLIIFLVPGAQRDLREIQNSSLEAALMHSDFLRLCLVGVVCSSFPMLADCICDMFYYSSFICGELERIVFLVFTLMSNMLVIRYQHHHLMPLLYDGISKIFGILIISASNSLIQRSCFDKIPLAATVLGTVFFSIGSACSMFVGVVPEFFAYFFYSAYALTLIAIFVSWFKYLWNNQCPSNSATMMFLFMRFQLSTHEYCCTCYVIGITLYSTIEFILACLTKDVVQTIKNSGGELLACRELLKVLIITILTLLPGRAARIQSNTASDIFVKVKNAAREQGISSGCVDQVNEWIEEETIQRGVSLESTGGGMLDNLQIFVKEIGRWIISVFNGQRYGSNSSYDGIFSHSSFEDHMSDWGGMNIEEEIMRTQPATASILDSELTAINITFASVPTGGDSCEALVPAYIRTSSKTLNGPFPVQSAFRWGSQSNATYGSTQSKVKRHSAFNGFARDCSSKVGGAKEFSCISSESSSLFEDEDEKSDEESDGIPKKMDIHDKNMPSTYLSKSNLKRLQERQIQQELQARRDVAGLHRYPNTHWHRIADQKSADHRASGGRIPSSKQQSADDAADADADFSYSVKSSSGSRPTAPRNLPASQTLSSLTQSSKTPASQTLSSQTLSSKTPESQTPASQTPDSQNPENQTPTSLAAIFPTIPPILQSLVEDGLSECTTALSSNILTRSASPGLLAAQPKPWMVALSGSLRLPNAKYPDLHPSSLSERTAAQLEVPESSSNGSLGDHLSGCLDRPAGRKSESELGRQGRSGGQIERNWGCRGNSGVSVSSHTIQQASLSQWSQESQGSQRYGHTVTDAGTTDFMVKIGVVENPVESQVNHPEVAEEFDDQQQQQHQPHHHHQQHRRQQQKQQQQQQFQGEDFQQKDQRQEGLQMTHAAALKRTLGSSVWVAVGQRNFKASAWSPTTTGGVDAGAGAGAEANAGTCWPSEGTPRGVSNRATEEEEEEEEGSTAAVDHHQQYAFPDLLQQVDADISSSHSTIGLVSGGRKPLSDMESHLKELDEDFPQVQIQLRSSQMEVIAEAESELHVRSYSHPMFQVYETEVSQTPHKNWSEDSPTEAGDDGCHGWQIIDKDFVRNIRLEGGLQVTDVDNETKRKLGSAVWATVEPKQNFSLVSDPPAGADPKDGSGVSDTNALATSDSSKDGNKVTPSFILLPPASTAAAAAAAAADLGTTKEHMADDGSSSSRSSRELDCASAVSRPLRVSNASTFVAIPPRKVAYLQGLLISREHAFAPLFVPNVFVCNEPFNAIPLIDSKLLTMRLLYHLFPADVDCLGGSQNLLRLIDGIGNHGSTMWEPELLITDEELEELWCTQCLLSLILDKFSVKFEERQPSRVWF